MKNLTLYIDLAFCLIVLPVMVALWPVERWFHHFTVYMVILLWRKAVSTYRSESMTEYLSSRLPTMSSIRGPTVPEWASITAVSDSNFFIPINMNF